MDRNVLKSEIKVWMISELKLNRTPDQITDDGPLFGPSGLGIDSLDALQLVMSAEEKWGVKVPMEGDADASRKILASVNALTDHVLATRAN